MKLIVNEPVKFRKNKHFIVLATLHSATKDISKINYCETDQKKHVFSFRFRNFVFSIYFTTIWQREQTSDGKHFLNYFGF